MQNPTSTLNPTNKLYYLTHCKSEITMFFLSIFLLPIALMYTRGFFGWLVSVLVMSLVLAAQQALIHHLVMLAVVTLITFLWYLVFCITDAKRVNNGLLDLLK